MVNRRKKEKSKRHLIFNAKFMRKKPSTIVYLLEKDFPSR